MSFPPSFVHITLPPTSSIKKEERVGKRGEGTSHSCAAPSLHPSVLPYPLSSVPPSLHQPNYPSVAPKPIL